MPTTDLTGAIWRKSSRSNGGGACVEIAVLPEAAAVRDSKNLSAGALVLDTDAWTSFRAAVKQGELDVV
jgi:environmental stress-induced protein Ves